MKGIYILFFSSNEENICILYAVFISCDEVDWQVINLKSKQLGYMASEILDLIYDANKRS